MNQIDRSLIEIVVIGVLIDSFADIVRVFFKFIKFFFCLFEFSERFQ